MLDLLIYLLLSLPLIGAYAMLGVGIVVIFRASRVLNLAHGAMAMFPAYLAYELSVHRHLPMVVVVPVAVASGGLLGMLTERVFVRTLRRQGPTAQTVGTVAMFGLVVSLVAKVWGTAPLIGPRIFPDGGPRLGGSTIFWGDLGLFLTAVVAAGALLAVFKFTDLGLSLRGAADNRVAAALVGIDPDRNARVAWLIGGSLAGVAGVLLGGVNNLSPYTLSLQMLPAFVAALIGGLGSLTGVLVGAACVGALQGLVPAMGLIGPLRRISGQLGLSQLVLTIIALTVMYLRGGKYSSSDIRAEQATGTADITAGRRRFVPTLPVARQKLLGVQIRAWRYLLLIVMLGWPFAGILRDDIEFTLLGDATQAGLYVIAAASIVLLTGWVGQISLAQAAFVGIGAFSSALLVRGWHVDFPLNLLLAGVIASVAAIVLGVVALRVRGLYLAVATLIFAYMADSYLFVSPWFSGSGGSSSADIKPIGTPETKPYFDFSERKTFYFVVLAVAAAVIFGLLNLRDSKTGRAFFAVRGSETAAASLGIDVRRYKLIAFAVAGGIAGVAGNLTLIGQGTVVSAQFNISASLLILAIAVVGGLQSLGGCVAASMVFAGLNELFFRVEAFTGYLDIASAVLLTAVLLLYPGGLAAVPHSLARVLAPLRERVSAWSSEHEVGARLERLRSTGLAGRVRNAMPWNRRETALGIRAAEPRPIRLPAVAPVAQETEVAEELPLTVHLPAGAVSSVIDVRGVRVEFDGLVAVDSADLQVGPGEIVGLIGPNGAGKTTLFNAISGLVVPTSGTVSLFGEDVTQLPVHERARRGLGRTFQAIQLFPQLSVYENLLVATHAANPTGLYAHVFLTRNGVRHEAAAEESVRRAIRFMRLEQVADRTVAGLPFGVLRRVEIARTLVGGWPVIMLDEPASGLDNAETDQLSELLLDLRDRLGVSLLLIEHDVRMVTGVSDRMYVLVHGKMVASGTPDVVREDPTVIAAYLGDAAATTDRTETVPA